MNLTCTIPTPLGEMVAIAEQDALSGLWFAGEKHAPEHTGTRTEAADSPLFRELQVQLADYFAGKPVTFDLPLAPQGTLFQMAVWELLRTIPRGATTTYGALAKRLAERRDGKMPAPQAVGGAVGRNPISIIIPCHRVIGSDGSLTGYAGGLDRKAALLALEKGSPLPLRR
jgi:methylated-DNA-[protein]-cysteine S-methyltransferase